jgi:cytochrome c oxidase subunit III
MQGSTVDSSQASLSYAGETEATEHGHSGHPDHRLFGMYLFLLAESMIFLGLFVAYGIFRSMSSVWPPAGTPETELLLPGINTLILISSSFVMNQGNRAIKENNLKGLRAWFLLTAAMGAIFLVGQGYEYFHTGFGLTQNIFTSTFYVLTGFHGLHVFFGLSLIVTVLLRSLKSGHYSSHNHFGIEAAELYWHFVDVIWIILFAILYLL